MSKFNVGEVWMARDGTAFQITNVDLPNPERYTVTATDPEGIPRFFSDGGAYSSPNEPNRWDLVKKLGVAEEKPLPVFDTDDYNNLTVSVTRTVTETLHIEVELHYGDSHEEVERKIEEAINETPEGLWYRDSERDDDVLITWDAPLVDGTIVEGKL